jgi:hypothetical protein
VFLGYYVYPRQGSERGEYTKTELQLNRVNLIERRKERIEKINTMINAAYRTSSEFLRKQAIAELRMEADKDKEYSAMVKNVLLAQDIL